MMKQGPFIKVRIVVLVACLALAACSGRPWNGAATSGVAMHAVPAGFYRVAAGDTLSSIAAGYARSVQQVAEWNGLLETATVAQGQLLRVAPIKMASNSDARGLQASEDKTGRLGRAAVLRPGGLAWPLRGPVLTRFVQGQHGNIEIGGKSGELVRAAAAGRVVYAGTGIRKYGALVIIKHDSSLITAYGHNSVLLVKDGDAVAQGQPVAQVGVSDADLSFVQFEIRMNGKQVDPLSYLPALGG